MFKVKYFLMFIFIGILMISGFVVYAQEELIEFDPDTVDVFIEDMSEEELRALREDIEGTSVFPADNNVEYQNVVSCFDYYNFNSVQVSVIPTVESTVPGTPMTFFGSVKNENNYPIIEGTIYVKIFKLRESDEKNANGQFVVDQFVAAKGINLPANGEKNIEFSWNVPAWAESGEYQLATFFISKDRYNLLGLSFTDDIVGNTAVFEVLSNIEGAVYFNKDTVRLNGEEHFFAAFPMRFSSSEPVNIDLDIINSTNKEEIAEVTYNIYSWDAVDMSNNFINSESSSVSIPANGTSPISFVMRDTSHPVYLVETILEYKDTKSILNIRFVRNDISRLRINFPSTATYPLVARQEATVFSCLHNLADTVEDGRLVLSVLDDLGNSIHSYEYDGKVAGEMIGIASKFIPRKTHLNFSLRADLYQNGNLVDQVKMDYRCSDFGLCDYEHDTKNNFLSFVISGIAVLVLLLISLFLRKKFKNNL